MYRCLVVLAAVALLVSCSETASDAETERRIAAVENGLVEFKSLATMFQPDSEQLANRKTLAERMEHYKAPGLGIAVVQDHQLEWSRAYGVMDVDTGMPVTTETLFEAGSTSKLLTAVLALHLVEKGLIDLDQDVNRYLERWQVPDNEFTLEEKVTLRLLLTHQAGMPETNYDHEEGGAYPTLLDVLNGKPPALNHPALPEYVPGSRWQYSNIGYNVIQLLLEDVAERGFQQIAEEIIFEPLGMESSTFVYPLEEDRRRLEAMPHDEEGISREPLMHRTALAHGGLTTTPSDLARFTRELMLAYQGRSGRVLSRNMAIRLFSKECEIDREKFPLPFSEGLGVFLLGEGEDLMFTHPGTNSPGLVCWLVGWPERGAGAVVMANGANGIFLGIEVIEAIRLEYDL